jgi:hypothetical protein
MMERIPGARDLTADEMISLRSIVGASFTPNGQLNASRKKRLIALGLIHSTMGGLMPTPAGRIVARM